MTVVFTTKQPDPLLPARLAFYGGQIIPKAYFEKVGPDEFNAKPVGSGVVKFNSWVVEMAATDQIFTRPRHRLTEDYITGRFG
jgi:ABC-type transport system substrate-binding protein